MFEIGYMIAKTVTFLALSTALFVFSWCLYCLSMLTIKILQHKYDYVNIDESIETEEYIEPVSITPAQDAALWNIESFKRRMAGLKERSNQTKTKHIADFDEEGLVDLQRSLELAKRQNKTGVELPNE